MEYRKQKKEISEILKGKKHIKCCCIICMKEVSANNLDKHFGAKVCLDNKRHTFSFSV